MRLILPLVFALCLSSMAALLVSNTTSNPMRAALYKRYNKIISEAKQKPVVDQVQSIIHPEAKLPFVEYVQYFNYPVEVHRVTTDDGYILTVFRIQRKYSTITNGLPVVFFQHGLLDCAEGWIINDESKAPALMLANLGYDVWLGNVRGNKYGREHIHFDPDNDAEFWQFSFDEMAAHDLPAFFEYVSNHTGQEKFDYIGHSQGTIIMFAALCDENPVVLKHLNKFLAVGPVAYVYHQSSTVMALLADSRLQYLLDIFNINEFLGENWLITNFGSAFCALFGEVCANLVATIADMDASRDNYERYDVVAGHDPSGTSVQNMVHWEQLTFVDNYQKYDYGTDENMKIYGQPNPPLYNLANIKNEVHLFAGDEDMLADPTDVQRLKNEMVNAKVDFHEYADVGHITFLWGIDMSYVNDMIKVLQN